MSEHYQIETTQNVHLGLHIASLGDRITAAIIDTAIKYAYVLIIALIFQTDTIAGNPFLFYLLIAPFAFYHLAFEIFNNGQSPGKKALNLQVVAINGKEVPIRSYILRWLFRLFDINVLSGLVAIISIATSDRNQRVGDRVADTTVVKKKATYDLRSTIFQDTEEDYVPVYPAVRRLNPQEVAIIREALDSKIIENREPHIRKLADKIAAKLQIELDEHPRKFLRTLLKDYNYINR